MKWIDVKYEKPIKGSRVLVFCYVGEVACHYKLGIYNKSEWIVRNEIAEAPDYWCYTTIPSSIGADLKVEYTGLNKSGIKLNDFPMERLASAEIDTDGRVSLYFDKLNDNEEIQEMPVVGG